MNDLISRTAVLRLLDENCVVFRGEIEKMPGVDAIPVEWLEEQREKEDRGTPLWWIYQAIINKWQEEQEAQDG